MKRLFPPIVASVLVLATAGVVLAWVQPALTARCAPDENSYAWTINLHEEGNYSIDWSFQSTFAGFSTIDFGSPGDHDFTTPRGGSTLYVRWSSDHASKTQAAANADFCRQQSVEESVAESVHESVAESVAESVHESVAESVAESVQESVAESVAESAGQSAEQSVEAGTGTPDASIPNTSVAGSGSNPLPTVIFAIVLLASLGGLAFTNVRFAMAPNRDR